MFPIALLAVQLSISPATKVEDRVGGAATTAHGEQCQEMRIPLILPPKTSFSFFQWYNGGYSFFQALTPTAPAVFYPPFRPGQLRELRPAPNLLRPPVKTPMTPAPRRH